MIQVYGKLNQWLWAILWAEEREQQYLGIPHEEGTAFFHGIYQSFACLSLAVLKGTKHQSVLPELFSLLHVISISPKREVISSPKILQQFSMRNCTRLEICNKAMGERCQIFYYSAQGKLTIQMRNRSTLSSMRAARSFSLSLLGPDKLSWYTSLDTSFPFYSVLFWGHHNQRSSWWERHFADTQGVPLWPLSPSSRQIMRMDWWMLLEPW